MLVGLCRNCVRASTGYVTGRYLTSGFNTVRIQACLFSQVRSVASAISGFSASKLLGGYLNENVHKNHTHLIDELKTSKNLT
jgi:hypothetical protein